MTSPEKELPPPRIRHNSALAAWFITQHKVTGRYPRVIDQVPVVELERQKLFKYGYNPSIVARDRGLLMAYRYHDGNTLHSDLALAQLDYNGAVIHNEKVALGAGGEDAKLFKFNGLVYMSWVESTFPVSPWRSVVRFGLLGEKGPKPILTPGLPGNDFSTMQKNWVFFSVGLELYCIYRVSPDHDVYQLKGDQFCNRFRTPGPKWPYGQIRGGTSPVPFEGNLLRFFHSGLDNEFGQYYRRYFMGAYIMRPEFPFEVLAVSSKPIVYGAEADRLKKADWAACPQYKRQVVFPGGAVEHPSGKGWLVSVGVNDSAIELLKIENTDLHLA